MTTITRSPVAVVAATTFCDCTRTVRRLPGRRSSSKAYQAVFGSSTHKRRTSVPGPFASRRDTGAKCCRARKSADEESTEAENTVIGLRSACTSVLATLVLLGVGWPAETHAAVQHLHQPETFQLATGEGDFWVNVSRYGRYFITVLLGTAYISVKPILQLLKRPKTAVAVILGLGALYLFVSTTVQAMLGVSNPLDYQPSGFFPENY